jgi:hypothetical protein
VPLVERDFSSDNLIDRAVAHIELLWKLGSEHFRQEKRRLSAMPAAIGNRHAELLTAAASTAKG